MKKPSIAHLRREYNASGHSEGHGRFNPLTLSQYWFQQALRALAVVGREYRQNGLIEQKAPPTPLELFQKWFKEALRAKVLDPNAMTLATVTGSGKPAVRTVLLKGFDAHGFVFFTNYASQKGRELAKRPRASLLFFWPPLMQQVRIDGKVVRVSSKESDEYFQSRPRGSQISTWVSRQSQVIPSREFLDRRARQFEKQFKGKPVPRPSYWGGFRLTPERMEFWSGRPNRLHDRLRYQKKSTGGWRLERLSP